MKIGLIFCVFIFLILLLIVLKSEMVLPIIGKMITGKMTDSLSINVTIISSEETPSDGGTGGGVSGGGGGDMIITKRDFYIDQNVIKVLLKRGESFKKTMKIKNTDKILQSFTLELTDNLNGMVYLSENSFVLRPKEEKEIFLTFVATEDIEPNVYVGRLIVKTSYITKEINIISSIRSKKVLFDISLDIPVKHRVLEKGGDLLFQVTLFNLGEIGKTNVIVDYSIKNFDGGFIFNDSELVAVETQASFSKTINLPRDIKYGDYLLIATARYNLSIGSANSLFHVKQKEPQLLKENILIIILIILIILLFLIYEVIKSKMELIKEKYKT